MTKDQIADMRSVVEELCIAQLEIYKANLRLRRAEDSFEFQLGIKDNKPNISNFITKG